MPKVSTQPPLCIAAINMSMRHQNTPNTVLIIHSPLFDVEPIGINPDPNLIPSNQIPQTAGASQVAKYDDLIEEASGELEQVESEVHGATQQLLDLQGRVRQLAHHTQAAEKTLQKVCPAFILKSIPVCSCMCLIWCLALPPMQGRVSTTPKLLRRPCRRCTRPTPSHPSSVCSCMCLM